MFDYQHKHLPHLFAEEERQRRDKVFAGMLAEAAVVIVNSRDTQSDIETFNPDRASAVVALPFTPIPDPAWFDADGEEVARKYELPKRYFLISNQFWRHKSHLTAFEALAILRQDAGLRDVKIICTGETRDTRHPTYFSELQKEIAALDIADAVNILGHIPKQDQMQIMKNAVAVIQPTLFEGGPGGGAVYDAVALGVRAIVSDIAVNREIEDAKVTFFTAGSSADLAEKMAMLLSKPPPRLDPESLLASAGRRTEKLGERLLEAIELAGGKRP